jgi:hypothetical protein
MMIFDSSKLGDLLVKADLSIGWEQRRKYGSLER